MTFSFKFYICALSFVRLPLVNLRCHERRCAHKVGEKLTSNSLADAEVTDLNNTLVVKQHVIRFDVSMDYLFAVAEFDCLTNLSEHR